jgi:dihydropteroate synthase
MKPYRIAWGRYALEMGRHTRIMGVVNTTPDSFSDGGLFFQAEAAVAHGQRLADEGADILDIGGESTRPYSDPVAVEEEMRRVVPVIEKLAPKVAVPLSIDTAKAAVAQAALSAGAAMINDIGALRMDPRMADVAAAARVPVVLMHMLGTPRTMQVAPCYDNLLGDIRSFLARAIDHACRRGICRDKIIIDPGIGFGKTIAHNLSLIRHVGALADLDAPILMGPSRKAFIRKILTDRENLEPSPLSEAVKTGTQAALAAAALAGAHILRVHDVAATRTTLKIIDAVRNVEMCNGQQAR